MTKKSVKVGTLKKEVYTEILTNSNLQAAVMLASGKSFSTVRVWASEQNARLETWKILNGFYLKVCRFNKGLRRFFFKIFATLPKIHCQCSKCLKFLFDDLLILLS